MRFRLHHGMINGTASQFTVIFFLVPRHGVMLTSFHQAAMFSLLPSIRGFAKLKKNHPKKLDRGHPTQPPNVSILSAALAYRQKWHMPRAPRFRGPAHLRTSFFCARVNCGIASWIVFTTAILHWHNILQHIRGNIRAPVEYIPMLLTRLDGFDTGKATE